MTVATVPSITQPQNNGNNNAAVKDWGSKISGLFSGAGIVKASDTGQVNWSTMTYTPVATTATNTLIGYEVWAFNDGLQGTKPIYLIVSYRQLNGTTSGQQYLIIISVVTATNGAGANAGSLSATYVISPLANTTVSGLAGWTGVTSAFASGDGSYLTLGIGNLPAASAATNGGGLGVFYVDRTRDSVGAITGEGCVSGSTGWSSNASQGSAAVAGTGLYTILSFTSVTSTVMGGIASANTGVTSPGCVTSTISSGASLGFHAPPVVANAKLLPPSLAAISYFNADITALSTVTLTLSGSSHTYLCLGTFATLGDRRPGQTTVALAVRYE